MRDSPKEDELDYNYRPIILSNKSTTDLVQIESLKRRKGMLIFDTFKDQLSELIRIKDPSKIFSKPELEDEVVNYCNKHQSENMGLGNWVYYPWRNTLLRILEEEDYITLRTSRNWYKITPEEQEILHQKTIGIIGLSVGQSVALSLAMERIFGELRIADPDHLDLSNMNRIRTGLYHLGIKKTWIVAREIAEIDPYLKVVLFDDGITEENLPEFFSLRGNLDLLIEECDNLQVKISSRLKAKELGIPVLMDTSDRGMIDIERFDLDPKRLIFHGFLQGFGSEKNLNQILGVKRKEILMALLQYENLSERAKFSFSEIGKTIITWPQLASSVLMGGAACSHYSRRILLDQKINSGRYYIDLDLLINSHES